MNVDSPSKNLIVTLPTAASHTTTSAACDTRWRPSMLPMKLRPDDESSSVASCTRCSPLPASSPIDSRATDGRGTPRTRSE